MSTVWEDLKKSSQTVDKLVLGFGIQSQFSFINQIAFKIKFVKWASPHFAFILASLYIFRNLHLQFAKEYVSLWYSSKDEY